jgi:hypothetical protein
VNPICRSCVERGKARPDAICHVFMAGERENSGRRTREGLSTDAGCVGGPACSSGEASAWCGGGGAKGPDCSWFVCSINRGCHVLGGVAWTD